MPLCQEKHERYICRLTCTQNLMVGDVNDIDSIISALKNNKLVLKVVEVLQDYLSCEIKFQKIKR